MEQYLVSARKYRPATFATVVGQSALTSTLKNSIATDHLAHAYLFCGSRGVGKTSCARIFAKTINCTDVTPDGEACGKCESCLSFEQGNSMNIIEFDAASHNGIDDMKAVIEQVQVPPVQGRYRVFIIDEVHMLSAQAFNAFLKTLEEPPSYVIFILATTEKHKIIPTILSRCQIYDFSRISIGDMVSHLQRVAADEGITAEPSALNIIAHQADGAMRDALSIFDQVAASSRGNITHAGTIAALNILDESYYNRLLDRITAGDIPGTLLIFHEIRQKGFDAQFFINGLGDYFRSLMLAGAESTRVLIDEPEDVKAGLIAAASKVSADFLYKAMNLCNEADLNYRQSSNKQMLVELTLIKVAQLLNPSPADSGRGEGSLKPITQPQVQQATSTAAPQPAVAQAAPAQTVVSEPAAPRYEAAPRPFTARAATMRHDTPRPAARPSGPQMRVGMLSMNAPAPARTTQEAAAGARQSEPVTPAGVTAAWNSYIDANGHEHALVNVMRASAPVQSPTGSYIVIAANDVEANKVNEHLPAILAHMRRELRNDNFTLNLNVSDQGPSPMFWNEQQVLGYMLEKHPQFREFVSDLKLTKL
ncbi:MAG: DNA polymerase III subunit gamma/tau [Muribaculaceae bacterium]|nr:DNA polymerase III subunit gamma/tau [Muribaculaceae bacterium]